MRRIGALISFAADDPEAQARLAAFVQGLQQSGWTDGRNVRIDTRWATTNADDLRRHAAELAALAPDFNPGAVVAGDPHRADRVRGCHRPGWRRFRRELGAAGRQRHRFPHVRIRPEREMAGTAQAGRAGRDASGGPARCGHRLRDRAVCRRPGGGAVLGGGVESGRRARCARNRACRHGPSPAPAMAA